MARVLQPYAGAFTIAVSLVSNTTWSFSAVGLTVIDQIT